MTRWTLRTQRVVFTSLVTIGLVAGAVLGIREAFIDPVLHPGAPRVRVVDGVATVQVSVRNTSKDTAYCPLVGIAAVDRDGFRGDGRGKGSD
ncbi:MAG TPA: hypothetical protein PLV68_04135, partial [Ilumatobacteraceae bacterium]|nr:hypothetical protein [Ilumatobacteraceae bacterium]